MEYLKVGRVVTTFGLKGEVKVFPSTSFPEERFKKGNTLFILDRNSTYSPLTIATSRIRKGSFFLSFEEIHDINEALNILSFDLFAPRKELKNGYYYYDDLLNSEVYDQDNNLIGILIKIEEYPAQLTFRVKRAKGKDILIPFVSTFVTYVDSENKRIDVKLIEGML